MIVHDVIYSDFSLLVDGYVKAKTENCGAGTYGVKANSYFDNMVISFHLANVNFIELICVRKLCSSLIPLGISIVPTNFDISSSKDNEIAKEYNNKFHKLAHNIESLRNSFDDRNIAYQFELDSVLLSGNYSFELIARFEGSNIMSIIGVFPESKFYNNELGNFEVPDKDSLDNMLISDFIKSLYGSINSHLSSVDILTDVMIQDKYFSYVNPESNIKLSHITSSLGEVRLLNGNSQTIAKELQGIKSFLRSFYSIYDFDSFCKNDIIYHMVVTTPLQTYMVLQLYTDFIYSEDDIKVLFASNDNEYFIPDELEDYDARITSLIQGITNLIEEVVSISKEESNQNIVNNVSIIGDTSKYGSKGTQTIKNQSSVFDRIGIYKLIPSSTYIRYTLRFTKSDFERIISSIPTWLTTSDISKLNQLSMKYFSTIENSLKIE